MIVCNEWLHQVRKIEIISIIVINKLIHFIYIFSPSFVVRLSEGFFFQFLQVLSYTVCATLRVLKLSALFFSCVHGLIFVLCL